MAATTLTSSTARYLVVATYGALGVIYQVACRTDKEAAELAELLWGDMRVTDVQVDYVPNYRGRRVTKVIL